MLAAVFVPLPCPALQPWYEVPFSSRRNIIATMVLGTAAVWVWNKSESHKLAHTA